MGRTIALIPAAGSGSRFGAPIPKQYAEIAGKTVIAHTLQRLAQSRQFHLLVVVLSPQDEIFRQTALPSEIFRLSEKRGVPENIQLPCPVLPVYCGGATRAHSVFNALQWLRQREWIQEDDLLAVHDAARCAVEIPDIVQVVDAAHNCEHGAILAVPVTDTLKKVHDGQVLHTVNRAELWQAQTPQVFPAGLLYRVMQSSDLGKITDEASAVEELGYTPRVVAGSVRNIKLTRKNDIDMLNLFLDTPVRIGQGYDVHRLVRNRPLILGGVCITHDFGLDGHSDADALLHALIDALLGAAGLGDIGRHFPDTDAAFKDADSRELLRQAYAAIREKGWRVVNADCTIITQRPRLAPHIPAMRMNISADLAIPVENINIKGKTNEKLGYLGREKAVETQATVLLTRASPERIS